MSKKYKALTKSFIAYYSRNIIKKKFVNAIFCCITKFSYYINEINIVNITKLFITLKIATKRAKTKLLKHFSFLTVLFYVYEINKY